MASNVMTRTSLRLLQQRTARLEVSVLHQSSASLAANKKYLGDLESIKEVTILNSQDQQIFTFCVNIPGGHLEDREGDRG